MKKKEPTNVWQEQTALITVNDKPLAAQVFEDAFKKQLARVCIKSSMDITGEYVLLSKEDRVLYVGWVFGSKGAYLTVQVLDDGSSTLSVKKIVGISFTLHMLQFFPQLEHTVIGNHNPLVQPERELL